jgi:hypothetical protein
MPAHIAGQINFQLNGKEIAVSVFSSHSAEDCRVAQGDGSSGSGVGQKHDRETYPIEDEIIDLAEAIKHDVCSYTYSKLVGAAMKVILEVGGPIFAQVAPFPAPSRDGQPLHLRLFPVTHNYRLQQRDGGGGGSPVLVPIAPEEAYMLEGQIWEQGGDDEFPSTWSSRVTRPWSSQSSRRSITTM